MEKHSFILIITIYFIHYDCGLPLRTRIISKSQWFKMPISSGNLNHCEVLLSFNKSVKCALDNSKYTRYNIWLSKDWSDLLYQKDWTENLIILRHMWILPYVYQELLIWWIHFHVYNSSIWAEYEIKAFLRKLRLRLTLLWQVHTCIPRASQTAFGPA